MRTTIELPDPLFRQMKAAAALQGSTIKDFVAYAVRRAIKEPAAERRMEVDLPLIRSDKPGTLKLTNADIEDLLT